MCLTFWYHMYGSSMGTLNMYIEMDQALPSVPMWTKSGDQGDEWHMVELQIDIVAEYRGPGSLYSTFVRPSDSTMCLTFWYHMYGSSMGTLNMYIEMDQALPSVPMWTKSGDQGDEWHMVELQIDIVAEYRVVFEGIIGTSFYSDIALDDITFVPGLCSSLIPACHPLGVESGAIADQDITAKSFSQSSQTTGMFPYNGRLHGGSAWVAGTVESGEWLQVDVGENQYISGVVTQGHATKLQWVTSYKLKFTTGAGDWVFYKINGIEKVD
ncbi:PREDICTED: MAM and LDL-receptor class A domain-containing protein 1-like [Branchiostoma belcheri]|uniref:MAM and LDL-receptor class A domain-containing protein 1-like n=1 Tax=Branchiostoma belcheri TaxID=7741 RepID=A0A6P4YJ53_BRABE|nr:PREDICTED: MAM and LDL-receptor class A domain-containing protein 1-like [Branchiostoma belcheri]